MASRHRSRELAVQLLYQWELSPKGMENPKSIDLFWSEQALASDDTREFFEVLVRGTAQRLPEIDTRLEGVLKNWKLSRIEKVDLSILRLALFEICYFDPPTPAPVVLDEAIEIAKKFGTKESPSFVNGVLDAVVKGMA